MRSEAAYLTIPPNYGHRLGGVAWSPRGDAIDWVRRDNPEESVGTFVLAPELSQFLDGLVGGRGGRLLPFAHVLHLLAVLGLRPRPHDPDETLPPPPPRPIVRLAACFHSEGKPLRNAGVLCGRLLQDLASIRDLPDPTELRQWLANDGPRVALMLRARPPLPLSLDPLVGPDEFERLLAATIEPLSNEEIATWLRNGTGPIGDVDEQLAGGLIALKPRSLDAALSALARRDRLAGAVPIVDQLDSALALPPRRSQPQILPTGGYADIGTKGKPEQILPSQFGLDEMEFLRRHAERELLYFQREEPNRATTEELVLLLDQGVRTWGKPRLALSAAAMALAKHAVRRNQSLLIGGTSSLGRLFDPRLADHEALGTLWEASDLTASPAAALRAVLGEPGEVAEPATRDVVLLTHPRSVSMPEVAEATRLAAPGVRVFAVAIDDAGQVLVREYRGGSPLKVGDFRVRWPEPRLPEPERPPVHTARSAWTGDVEPVGYPFPVRWEEPPSPIHFDFDADSRWLFAASPTGLTHAWRLNGHDEETLPRAMVEDDVLDKVDMILGVRGGFVIAGRMARSLILAHYDMERRTVHTRILGSTWNQPWQWFYRREDHLVIARGRDLCRGYDLTTRQVFLSRGTRTRVPLHLIRAFEAANNHLLPPPTLKIVHDRTEQPDRGEWIHLDRKAGTVTLHGLAENWEFVPTVNGQPALKDAFIEHAQRRGDILALVTCRNQEAARLWIIDGATGETIREYDHLPTRLRFLLSPDSRWIARAVKPRMFELRPLDGPPRKLNLAAPPVKHEHRLEVTLGNGGIYFRWGGEQHVLLRWRTGRLEWLHVKDLTRKDRDALANEVQGSLLLSAVSGPGHAQLPVRLDYDPERFLASVRVGHLYGTLEKDGAVILWGRESGLIAMIQPKTATAWTPDGSTWALDGDRGESDALGRRLADALLRAQDHPLTLGAPPATGSGLAVREVRP